MVDWGWASSGEQLEMVTRWGGEERNIRPAGKSRVNRGIFYPLISWTGGLLRAGMDGDEARSALRDVVCVRGG